MTNSLLQPTHLGKMALRNKVVMAPLTRSRAMANVPNGLMAEYYGQRAGAGLIITEGTAPSPDGLGYARIPGAYSEEQVRGWKMTTEAVHKKGGKIFLQIMHTGRVSHPLNMPTGAEVIAPSAVRLEKGQMYTDQEGMQDYPMPRAIATAEIPEVIDVYVHTAKQAIEAGFDGVELHGANGYLLEQFLHPAINQRTDDYGGSMDNRLRLVIETAQAVSDAIGPERVGIRVSPYGAFNGTTVYDELNEAYTRLAQKLSEVGLLYMHLVDHSSMGTPTVPDSIKKALRENFSGALILSGGYDKERAEADLQADKADLIAFGKPWISNPDLVERFEQGAALADWNDKLFYTPGPEGYTDYPALDD